MEIEVLSQKTPSVRLTVSGDEIKYLRMALERATFVDTPPLDQKAIYNFADELLRRLEKL